VPTRGSRLDGLLSIIMTSVFASGFLEQESKPAQSNKQKIFNPKGHQGTQRWFIPDRTTLRAPLCPL
jgi:hypothetical protein